VEERPHIQDHRAGELKKRVHGIAIKPAGTYCRPSLRTENGTISGVERLPSSEERIGRAVEAVVERDK
jgi:hypothetical protein